MLLNFFKIHYHFLFGKSEIILHCALPEEVEERENNKEKFSIGFWIVIFTTLAVFRLETRIEEQWSSCFDRLNDFEWRNTTPSFESIQRRGRCWKGRIASTVQHVHNCSVQWSRGNKSIVHAQLQTARSNKGQLI